MIKYTVINATTLGAVARSTNYRTFTIRFSRGTSQSQPNSTDKSYQQHLII